MELALYPGSFDPLTKGHLDIIIRSCSIFDTVLVGVINNPNKKSLFSLEKRKEMIQRVAEAEGLGSQIQVGSFDGLLVDYVKQKKIKTVIRGLRAVSDFEYELALSLMNKGLYPPLETVFLMASHEYSFLSSNLIKEVFQYGGDVTDYLHPIVMEEMNQIKK
jgi:pantetheine-phosphate adenylyltransferase